MQKQYWMVVLDWLRHEEQLEIQSTEGVLAVKQPASVIDFFSKFLKGLSDIQLAGFERSVISTKSFLLTYALFKKRVDVEFASTAARLEVLHQIQKWGEVEDSHDTDREELKRQLGAISMLVLDQDI